MNDSPVSNTELDRQYRVLSQTLAIHVILRDEYARRALFIELILLACSVVFCAVTFAEDGLFEFLGMPPTSAKYALGIASILALIASLFQLQLNLRGASSRHADSADRWSVTLQRFREAQADGDWPSNRSAELSEAYWDASRNSAHIPEQKFLRCKSRYLLNRRISRLKREYPGCPRLILRFVLRWQDTIKGIVQIRIRSNEGDGAQQTIASTITRVGHRSDTTQRIEPPLRSQDSQSD